MILSVVTELLGLPVFGSIFHFCAEPNSPKTLLYAYIVNDVVAASVCLATASPSFYRFMKEPDGQNDVITEDDAADEDDSVNIADSL
ncbi:hypothetical protein TVAG_124890 [Trichomonas vaginalis G3]|uniref:Uncharacterized protein n=1 Tax=Trichomonas vaginalis (strain ATCC PRA-98 / G3) TaxID=412133 RepID=A2EIJ5_TRIV3|nr:hypothetical protein TVAGG3_0199830 [Trichomonas vaginalis G3]EAY07516.1 hypothetical protein TVAG_124890 [Trichomonas vaginalis G3]KAI5550530.1 hypothetical protein TVAGG3_0199830 [Trichomonas vaginalis G3]|eukprot:XP_001319739.1 hypothetical protein [Trichomonas vaginalis G3]